VDRQSDAIDDDEAKEGFTHTQSQADSIAAQQEKMERAIQTFEEQLRAQVKHLAGRGTGWKLFGPYGIGNAHA
jgi:cytochrome c-type biogenesis protein CcmH/NrfG